uniref:CCHC-type domain-containing protein n=1 Tax=Solanum lycopersicum TaxID=4081 RepID=A0A3Q7IGZ8_SOLLC
MFSEGARGHSWKTRRSIELFEELSEGERPMPSLVSVFGDYDFICVFSRNFMWNNISGVIPKEIGNITTLSPLSRNIPPKVNNNNRGRSRPNNNRSNDTRSNPRDQPLNFRKNYEDRKRGAPQREGCYICGETTHAAWYCPSLRKLSAMVAAEKQQEKAAAQASSSAGEKRGQSSGADKGKNVAVGMFNHMALISHISIAALAAKPAGVRPRESLFVDAKLNGNDVRIMVDTGATHNFVTEQKAKELGLNYVASNTKLKTLPMVNLIQKKQDWTMRMCVDYRMLNKAIVKNKCPVSLMQDLMDRLSKACWFTKLDLRVRIAEGDETKTTCVTRYGSYEFLVMPFGLTNASATFCNLMNNVLFDNIDDFVVVYLDDLLYIVEHWMNMSITKLRKYTLYVKVEKCEFAQQEIKFLGHLVSKNQVRMDPKKVQTIVDWQTPGNVKDLQSFLGLANYYRNFIMGYSKRAAALTDLLKKDAKWIWVVRSEETFQNLKEAITSEPILKLPDFELSFEVHTDAFDKAIGGMLVQEVHHVAFESRKLNDAKQRY